MSSYRSLVLLLAAPLVACGGGGAVTPNPQDPIAWGGQLYGHHCASCHGDSGQGHGAPAVVGANALPLDPPPNAKFRKNKFATAADVFEFVHTSMPPGHGGSLTDDEYWAIMAFDLHANGVNVTGKLDATSAAQIKLH